MTASKALAAALVLLSAATVDAIEVFTDTPPQIPERPVLAPLAAGVYNDPVTLDGVSISGAFVGQQSGAVTITPPPPTYPADAIEETYETITGAPSANAGLALFGQGIDKNVELQDFSEFGIPKIIGGLLDTAGEAQGALSLLFDYNVSIFGLDMIGANFDPDYPNDLTHGDPGYVYFQFFRADGGLIGDTVSIRAYDGPVWFRSLDAPIRGVTITSTDYQGLGYNAFRFQAAPVPPVTALLTLGLALLAATAKRPRESGVIRGRRAASVLTSRAADFPGPAGRTVP